jgi:hypothetical protein
MNPIRLSVSSILLGLSARLAQRQYLQDLAGTDRFANSPLYVTSLRGAIASAVAGRKSSRAIKASAAIYRSAIGPHPGQRYRNERAVRSVALNVNLQTLARRWMVWTELFGLIDL